MFKSSAESASSGSPVATVVITTKNRSDELQRALASVFAQSCPVEVIVIDDASTDGTAQMVQQQFPRARLVQSEISRGYIVQRNAAAELATTPYIFSIDDDAAFSTPEVVRQTIADFSDDRIGAVAIPCVEINRDRLLHQSPPDHRQIYVTDRFVGTAYALRRDLFLQLGGFRTFFFHQGEESDFCTRMLDRGHVVRLGTSDPIHHYESPRRNFERMDIYGRRNDVLYGWCNVPALWLVPHLAATTVRGILFGCKVGRPGSMLRGLAYGYAACLRQWRHRQPVTVRSYRLFRYLRQKAALPISAIEASLK